MRIGAKICQEEVRALYDEGALFRLSAQNLYEKVCDRFGTRGLMILTPASLKKE